MSEQASGCEFAPQTCLCCVCCLRRGPEIGRSFDVDDPCCWACHDEMAELDWPGHRCSAEMPTAANPAPKETA